MDLEEGGKQRVPSIIFGLVKAVVVQAVAEGEGGCKGIANHVYVTHFIFTASPRSSPDS